MALLNSSWLEHVNRACYQGQWDVLALTAPAHARDQHPILQTFAIQHSDAWCKLATLKQCPQLNHWLDTFQCSLKSIRLMRLAPNSHIKAHCDNGLGWEDGEARLHLPVETSSEVDFLVQGQSVPMQSGELWYINAGEMHEVTNHSQQPRIHLVIDCEINDWLQSHFRVQ